MQPADLTNVKFGRLTAKKRIGTRGGHALWRCVCECGNVREITATSLKDAGTKSCGCLQRNSNKARANCPIGRRFGKLVIVAFKARVRSGKQFKTIWTVRCDCGRIKDKSAALITRGLCRSCGCLFLESVTKHGLSKMPEYDAWIAIKQRCYNQKNPGFKDYGQRGVRMFSEWRRSFEAFYSAVGPRPSPKHSIDRFPDNDGNYEPGNVRWATTAQQHRNTRYNVFVTYLGRRLCKADLARKLRIPVSKLVYWMGRGDSMQMIIQKAKTAHRR